MRKRGCVYFSLVLGFILGVKGGFIALWQEGDPEPMKVFPYMASALPKADQEALERGIHVEGGEDLNRLIEDFLS